jgi:hypothetical protein
MCTQHHPRLMTSKPRVFWSAQHMSVSEPFKNRKRMEQDGEWQRQKCADVIYHTSVVIFLARTCQAIDSQNKICDQVVEGVHLSEKSQETKTENMTTDMMHSGKDWGAVFYCTMGFSMVTFSASSIAMANLEICYRCRQQRNTCVVGCHLFGDQREERSWQVLSSANKF